MCEVRLVGSQPYPFQGISYQISVYEVTDGYWAFSYCEACALQNFQADTYDTADEAIASSGELIREHHALKHR